MFVFTIIFQMYIYIYIYLIFKKIVEKIFKLKANCLW